MTAITAKTDLYQVFTVTAKKGEERREGGRPLPRICLNGRAYKLSFNSFQQLVSIINTNGKVL